VLDANKKPQKDTVPANMPIKKGYEAWPMMSAEAPIATPPASVACSITSMSSLSLTISVTKQEVRAEAEIAM